MNQQAESFEPMFTQQPGFGPDDQAAPKPEVLHCPAYLFRAVGTQSTGAVRWFYSRLLARYGSMPGHLCVTAMDTTDQPRLDGITSLPSHCFVNVARLEQLQTRLRRAREDPRVAAYLHEIVTRLAVGDGAGGFPSAARYFLELKLPEVEAGLRQLLQPFCPAERPALCNRANLHSYLREWNMQVNPDGALRVIYVVNTTGGTAGVFIYDVMLLKYVLRQLQIEANFTLLLTLPARTAVDDVNSLRGRQLCHARFQELVDLDAGKVIRWPLAAGTLEASDRLFDTIFVVGEPFPDQLQSHQRHVGDLLRELTTPLGRMLFSKAADMVPEHVSTGPRGQKRLLDVLRMVTIESTAFSDPAEYARAVLSLDAVASRGVTGGPSAVSNLLERLELTAAALASPGLKFDVVSLPPGLDGKDADAHGFINFAEAEAREQGDAESKRLAQEFERRCDAAVDGAGDLLRRVCLNAGPRAAFAIGQSLAQAVRALELAAGLPVPPSQPKPEPATPDAAQLLRVRLETVQGQALSEFRSLALGDLRRLSVSINHQLLAPLERASSVFAELEIAAAQQRESFLMEPQPEHALLDRTTIGQMVREKSVACTAQVRTLASRVFERDFSPARLKAEAEKTINDHTASFAGLATVAEALRAAGERGKTALENAAVQATALGVRTDPQSDWERVALCHAYVNVPESHPLVAFLRQRNFKVLSAASGAGERRITLLMACWGLEPSALSSCRDALEAHAASTVAVLSHADLAYQSFTEVVVPVPSEWYAYLALPFDITWNDNQGRLRYDELEEVYLYDGQPIGNDRIAASAALLARDGRLPFLPSFEALTEQVKAFLHEAAEGDLVRVVKVLRAVEAGLQAHIARNTKAREDAKVRQKGASSRNEESVLGLELASARALRAAYEARIRKRDDVRASYTRPATDVSERPSHISLQEPSHDGVDNHRPQPHG